MSSLVELIGASVPLRRKGTSFWAPCPFHKEKTSSFHIVPTPKRGKPFYHCFGCGAHGDDIEWIRQTRNVGYREACHILGTEAAAKPHPRILAARQREADRQRHISAYRDRNPDCCCPDWLLAT